MLSIDRTSEKEYAVLVVTGERKERKEGNNLDIYSPVKHDAGQSFEHLKTIIKRFQHCITI